MKYNYSVNEEEDLKYSYRNTPPVASFLDPMRPPQKVNEPAFRGTPKRVTSENAEDSFDHRAAARRPKESSAL